LKCFLNSQYLSLGDLEYYRKERVLWVSLLVEGVGGGVVVLWRTVCFCLYAYAGAELGIFPILGYDINI
jgi:hypothetical protein